MIGAKGWSAQNLNIGIRINGSLEQTDNQDIEKYCYFDLESNCDIYGGLYQGDEMMQYTATEGIQGICPAGWHLPTDGEWTVLTTYLGGEDVAGGKMKSTGTIEVGTGLWYSPNTAATNSSGFTALPGGNRGGNGHFEYLTNYAGFWSSTENSSAGAWYRNLYYNGEGVSRFSYYKLYGFSCRCIQD